MSRDLPIPAPWIAQLPKDGRGFAVPAEAGWVDQQPVLAKVDGARKIMLGLNRACAVCGFTLPKGHPVYRAFAQADAAQIRGYESERAEDPTGPVHRSCILYSSMVCPYLRERNARLSKSSDINPGGRRGARAAVMGFEDFGLMMPLGRPFSPSDIHFGYINLVDDIRYQDGSELAEQYAEAVESDTALIDTSGSSLFWADDAEQIRRLGRVLDKKLREITRREPDYLQEIAGVGRFGVIRL